VFDDPAYILKRELMWIPFFGWCAWKADMIPVDRGARSQALAAMTVLAKVETGRGRQIIIFPEGTRRAPGAEPKYKFGVVHLYGELGVPCVPVALNSGLFWPRRSFRRYPGTIRVEILDPIAPGLDKAEFAARLQNDVEAATARLVERGRRELAPSGEAVRMA
jgi:1-acyl-sn-glycerol-3-phosphate acyltransferase